MSIIFFFFYPGLFKIEVTHREHSLVCPTITWAGVEPMVDIEGAGFACDSGGHGLVRVVLVFWQENIEWRRGDDLCWTLRLLRRKTDGKLSYAFFVFVRLCLRCIPTKQHQFSNLSSAQGYCVSPNMSTELGLGQCFLKIKSCESFELLTSLILL